MPPVRPLLSRLLLAAGGALALGLVGAGGRGVNVLAPRPAEAGALRAITGARHAFEANRGQADPRVRFLSRGAGYTLFLTQDEAVLAMGRGADDAPARSGSVRVRFPGARLAGPEAGARLPGQVHYLRGQDPGRWRTHVPVHESVRYPGVYPGIDLVFHSQEGPLEYDFQVAPGADPDPIRVEFAGADRLELRDGELVLTTPAGEVRQKRPVAYQLVDGKRVSIPCEYRLGIGTTKDTKDTKGEAGIQVYRYSGIQGDTPNTQHLTPNTHSVSFEVGSYDKTKPLTIDPALVYCTYFGHGGGGRQRDDVGAEGIPDFGAKAVAADEAGNTYLAGTTSADDLPVTDGAVQSTRGGDRDMFVAKIGPDGSLLYATYLGGDGDDVARAIRLGADGSVFVAGDTGPASNPMPATPGALQSGPSGGRDAWICRLQPDGAGLNYATFLGSTGNDSAEAIAIDRNGTACVAGETGAPDFPTTGGPGPELGWAGELDSFCTRLNADGTGMIYSTFMGGSKTEEGKAVFMDEDGIAYLTGLTTSPDIPVSENADQPAYSGNTDAFLAKFDTANNQVLYATYLGEGGEDTATGIAVDGAGNMIVAGHTEAPAFRTRGGVGAEGGINLDAFATLIDKAGKKRGTRRIGGSGKDVTRGVSLDQFGKLVLAGVTGSRDFPTRGAVQGRPPGLKDGFITKLRRKPGASGAVTLVDDIEYSTYLGGSDDDSITAVAKVGGFTHVVGATRSFDLPVTGNPIQNRRIGATDNSFIARLADDGGAYRLSPASRTFRTLRAGEQQTIHVPIRNTGPDALNGAVVRPSGAFAVVGGGGLFTLAPGQTRTVEVQFRPERRGRFTGRLTVITGARVRGTQTVLLTGSAR